MARFYFRDTFVGNNSQTMRGILSLKYPIERGTITNWEDIEEIWNYTFDESLGIFPSEHEIIFLGDRHDHSNHYHTEKMMQIMFERFGVPAFYSGAQDGYTLSATGRGYAGIIIDIGAGLTRIIPISQGEAIQDKCLFMNLGGIDFDNIVANYLPTVEQNICYHVSREIGRKLKEKSCFVPYFSGGASQPKTKVASLLPDGTLVKLDGDFCKCGEGLFDPKILGLDEKGIDLSLIDVLKDFSPEMQKKLCRNVVVCGGTTAMAGFVERFKKNLYALHKERINFNIIDMSSKAILPWIGGSIFSLSSAFDELKTSKQEYEETGEMHLARCSN
mmetsp:Transcript_3973/g.6059  ORF Transcript_3973/g.6059 Transcript_3973/m.6059 type:complete len:331 (-) Transcript_3973:2-994(-)